MNTISSGKHDFNVKTTRCPETRNMTNKSHQITIRAATPGDHPGWLALRRALWPDLSDALQRDEMKAWLARPDGIVLIAVEATAGSRVVGFAEVGTRSVADGCESSPVAYLEGWCVDAGMRRRGIGAALVRAAEDWARAKGLREFASDAELANTLSQHAHGALGFKEVGRSVLYVKVL
jgi:aminoglycoside 6'-N-acetyltransferase I